MDLLVIRHGQSEADILKVIEGRANFNLIELGYKQESHIDFRMRAEMVMSKVVNENDDKETIAIVSHGGMINMLFRSLLESPIKNKISVKSSDTGIHHWRINNGNKVKRR